MHIDFKIVRGTTLAEVQEEVQDALNDGWEIAGDVRMLLGMICLPMVRGMFPEPVVENAGETEEEKVKEKTW